MSANDAAGILDELLDTLEVKLTAQRERGPRDAIEAILGAEPRSTRARSLRDAPEVVAFRQALVDGLIRVDTVNGLLSLLNQLIVRLGTGAA